MAVVRDLRLCRYCAEVHQLKVVESEEHVLYKCPLYREFRSEFLHACQNKSDTANPANAVNISENNYNYCCNYENLSNDMIFFLSKFCHKIFKYRKAFHDHFDDYTD